ncbi:MAG: hypothetical protein JKY56_13820 [Kofleriaceae bacterium]|nr:hypothetical protein [Kofleriaceae bacterium]
MATLLSKLPWSLCTIVILVSCGDGLRGQSYLASDGASDSSPSQADATLDPIPTSCLGAEQLGCESAQKCALIPPRFRCVPNGDRALDEACTIGVQGDDCLAGLHCYQGVCNSLCNADVPCGGEYSCISITTEGERASICLPPCDPLAQDCPDLASGVRQACYLHISGSSVCAAASGSPPLFPGQVCHYLNECAIGAGCVVVNGQSICRAYCDYETNTEASDPRCSAKGRCAQLGDLDEVGVCQ